jgi:hypothetical protein
MGVTALPSAPSAQELRAEWIAADLEGARTLDALLIRVEQLERRVDALSQPDTGPDPLAELARFRAAVRTDLLLREEQLEALRTAVAELVAAVASTPLPAPGTVIDEEQRAPWAARSRSDDVGERFSAICFLGKERSDVGVAACLERISEPGEATQVVWMALRSLGRFRERSVAVDVARMLDHAEPIIRSAALDALRAMGAPDSGFDPTASAEERGRTSAALAAWAREQR